MNWKKYFANLFFYQTKVKNKILDYNFINLNRYYFFIDIIAFAKLKCSY